MSDTSDALSPRLNHPTASVSSTSDVIHHQPHQSALTLNKNRHDNLSVSKLKLTNDDAALRQSPLNSTNGILKDTHLKAPTQLVATSNPPNVWNSPFGPSTLSLPTHHFSTAASSTSAARSLPYYANYSLATPSLFSSSASQPSTALCNGPSVSAPTSSAPVPPSSFYDSTLYRNQQELQQHRAQQRQQPKLGAAASDWLVGPPGIGIQKLSDAPSCVSNRSAINLSNSGNIAVSPLHLPNGDNCTGGEQLNSDRDFEDRVESGSHEERRESDQNQTGNFFHTVSSSTSKSSLAPSTNSTGTHSMHASSLQSENCSADATAPAHSSNIFHPQSSFLNGFSPLVAPHAFPHRHLPSLCSASTQSQDSCLPLEKYLESLNPRNARTTVTSSDDGLEVEQQPPHHRQMRPTPPLRQQFPYQIEESNLSYHEALLQHANAHLHSQYASLQQLSRDIEESEHLVRTIQQRISDLSSSTSFTSTPATESHQADVNAPEHFSSDSVLQNVASIRNPPTSHSNLMQHRFTDAPSSQYSRVVAPLSVDTSVSLSAHESDATHCIFVGHDNIQSPVPALNNFQSSIPILSTSLTSHQNGDHFHVGVDSHRRVGDGQAAATPIGSQLDRPHLLHPASCSTAVSMSSNSSSPLNQHSPTSASAAACHLQTLHICRKWNRDECAKGPMCPYSHLCLLCSGTHPRIQCPTLLHHRDDRFLPQKHQHPVTVATLDAPESSHSHPFHLTTRSHPSLISNNVSTRSYSIDEHSMSGGGGGGEEICLNWNYRECYWGTKCHRLHLCDFCSDSTHRAVSCPQEPGRDGGNLTEVCVNWNHGKCRMGSRCKRTHVCLDCNADHPLIACNSNPAVDIDPGEICLNFNTTRCRFNSGACRRLHLCSLCGAPDHPALTCPDVAHEDRAKTLVSVGVEVCLNWNWGRCDEEEGEEGAQISPSPCSHQASATTLNPSLETLMGNCRRLHVCCVCLSLHSVHRCPLWLNYGVSANGNKSANTMSSATNNATNNAMSNAANNFSATNVSFSFPLDVCVNWNHHTCRLGDRCKRKHLCSICAQPHPVHSCPIIPSDAQKQVCSNWNNGRCRTKLCRRFHVCSRCSGQHLARDCMSTEVSA